MRYLEEAGEGFPTPGGVVPIVPSAVIYDLGFLDASFRPTPAMGYAAARSASSGPPARGSVGAGAGATVGKIFGIGRAMKGGFGTASERGGGTVAGACAVVNAFGDVVDPETGAWIAGAREEGGNGPAWTEDRFREGFHREPFAPGNTTLAVVATAEQLARDELMTVARMAHGALSRAIRPVHTPMDGDIVFAISTGLAGRKGNVMQAATLASRALEKAILDAVLSAAGTRDVPSAGDLSGKGGRGSDRPD
jgi:L-aminopeptidase/D-esterase-like protein